MLNHLPCEIILTEYREHPRPPMGETVRARLDRWRGLIAVVGGQAAAPLYTSTVGRILERSARRTPDRPALIFGERSWSYADLDRAVGRVAAGLLGLGLVAGDRVAAFGKNSDAYLLLYLGCARAGLVHVPVNFNARSAELAYLLTQSEPAAVFCDPDLEEYANAVTDASRPAPARLAAR